MPAPRPHAAARTAPPPTAADPLEDAVRAVVALLVSIEQSPSGPAAGAFRAALRRKGEALVTTGGSPALLDALSRVRAADPERARERDAVLSQAWAGLPGWLD